MSVIVAYKRNDVVYLAADSQTSIGSNLKIIEHSDMAKIMKMPDGKIFCAVGTVAISQYIQSHFDMLKTPNGEPLTKEFLVKEFMPKLISTLIEKKYIKVENDHYESFGSFFIIEGTNIFQVSMNGVFVINDCGIIGSGSRQVMAYAIDLENAPDNQIEEILYNGIKACAKNHLYVGLPALFYNTKDDCFKTKGDDQICF